MKGCAERDVKGAHKDRVIFIIYRLRKWMVKCIYKVSEMLNSTPSSSGPFVFWKWI
jgi:hypothetical protein